MARQYKIHVPYTTTGKDGLAISMGLNLPQAHAALSRLKPEVVTKLRACTFWHHETFSKAELDSVPDDLWMLLEKHIG